MYYYILASYAGISYEMLFIYDVDTGLVNADGFVRLYARIYTVPQRNARDLGTAKKHRNK